MNRIDALRLIAAEKGRAVSISTMRALPDWWEVGGAADFHLDNRTCMGASAALGLGIALARPDRRVPCAGHGQRPRAPLPGQAVSLDRPAQSVNGACSQVRQSQMAPRASRPRR